MFSSNACFYFWCPRRETMVSTSVVFVIRLFLLGYAICDTLGTHVCHRSSVCTQLTRLYQTLGVLLCTPSDLLSPFLSRRPPTASSVQYLPGRPPRFLKSKNRSFVLLVLKDRPEKNFQFIYMYVVYRVGKLNIHKRVLFSLVYRYVNMCLQVS